MKIELGSIVKNKKTGIYGTVEYSSFGYSIHTYEDYAGKQCLCKTLALRADKVVEYYDFVELPNGYEVGEYGGVYPKFHDEYESIKSMAELLTGIGDGCRDIRK